MLCPNCGHQAPIDDFGKHLKEQPLGRLVTVYTCPECDGKF